MRILIRETPMDWKATHLNSGRQFRINVDEPQTMGELSLLNSYIKKMRLFGPWKIESPDRSFVYAGMCAEQVDDCEVLRAGSGL